MFLTILAKELKRYQCELHAYCLMTNHYHLLLETSEYEIWKLMKNIAHKYAMYFNSVVYDSLSCPQLDSFHCPITAYIRVQGSVLVIRDVTPRIISHSLNNSLKFFQRICDGSSIFVSKGFIPSHNRFVIPEDIIQIGQFTAHTPVGNTQKHSVAL